MLYYFIVMWNILNNSNVKSCNIMLYGFCFVLVPWWMYLSYIYVSNATKKIGNLHCVRENSEWTTKLYICTFIIKFNRDWLISRIYGVVIGRKAQLTVFNEMTCLVLASFFFICFFRCKYYQTHRCTFWGFAL
jgi:hypothetical protein